MRCVTYLVVPAGGALFERATGVHVVWGETPLLFGCTDSHWVVPGTWEDY